jgi:hypothetical protein
MWIYAAVIALQFVLALGNRPKGEVGLYGMSDPSPLPLAVT